MRLGTGRQVLRGNGLALAQFLLEALHHVLGLAAADPLRGHRHHRLGRHQRDRTQGVQHRFHRFAGRHHQVGGAQARCQALGQGGDVIHRAAGVAVGGQRRCGVPGQQPVGIVFDHGQIVALGDRQQGLPALCRHRCRGRVLDGRYQVQQARAAQLAGFFQRIGQHAFGVHRYRHHAPLQHARGGQQARVGQLLGGDQLARLGAGQDQCAQRGLRARANHHLVGTDRAQHRRQPLHRGGAVLTGAGADVVAHQFALAQLLAHVLEAGLHALCERRAAQQRRDVHAQVHRGAAVAGRQRDEGAAGALRVEQAGLAQLGEGAGDRGQVHAHLLGQVALRRQAVARAQHAVIHRLAHLLGNLQVQRAGALAEGANPGAIGVFQAAAGGRWRHRSGFSIRAGAQVHTMMYLVWA